MGQYSLEPKPCRCGAEVGIVPEEKERGGLTVYMALCPNCGVSETNLGGLYSGRKAEAIRAWNRIRKEEEVK